MRSFVVAVPAAAFMLFLGAVPAAAFDTGPHANITIDSTMRAGFNRAAADAVQVENWLTDYYTSSPTLGSSAAQCDLEKLHFDDVFSNADIDRYWKTLVANTQAAAKQAEANNDVVEFYTVLGISLHVVQDFYTHSNWVEQNGASGPYKTRSWFQTTTPPAGLYTGWYANCLKIPEGSHVPHGGYTSGLNHDSVVRPRYDRAYVYALGASYEWTQNVLSWIGPSFAAKVKAYSPSSRDANDLAYDQKASIYISEWIENPLNTANLDGHWNGNRSGYTSAFAAFSAKWTASHNSVYVSTFKNKKIYAALSKNLYTSTAGTMPPFTAHPTSGTVFAMRTVNVYANSAFTGTDSYFGLLAASNVGNGGTPYRDASQYHRPRTDVPWLQLILVPSSQSSIDFTYSLWNEWITTNNDQVPIKGSKKQLSFRCSTSNASCSGDIAGGPWSAGSPFEIKGSGINGVRVRGYFTTTPAAP
jgi:hypothetical protein